MVFDDEFLGSFKHDPLDALNVSIQRVKAEISGGQGWVESDYEVLVEWLALISEAIEAELVNVPSPTLDLSGTAEDTCKRIFHYLKVVEAHCEAELSKSRFATLRSRFKTALGNGFAYEFTQGDLEKVQALINQLRDLIAEAQGLKESHKQRLLSRLERLQSEIHKKVSDLDRFWGLIGDAGVVLGKLGTDAKPIVDRIREVADIVWQTQSRAEELPSGVERPQLPNPHHSES
ncbi:cell fate (sporulation/competence/biofilm development) regulator YlbF (YheA/YmcA/DUF963 family) [Hydrogenophaga palleronii]|uniref:Cell fate (Sporulation/competence/biofilm development) regulator YlbF (YheA/YmcA/DUF963 family) n=1 Tax=Hydrogenophaga palleronii TaxID=65655 RepID=A0ABU1WG57_9BURK|nr:hypothetical protein [Hydrogenophaga palleronii]MDR7148256.1 cell fate (sporulation/competence/biofilm development) regulator YlbF (YheA/YmcA/DUF963 family) [Hydrogenophaga palleronii]